jgi:hypothetical protein
MVEEQNYSNNSIQPHMDRNPLEDSAHIWALNSNDDALMNFLNSLQGKIYDRETKTWKKIIKEELFNDECKITLYTQLSSLISTSNSMGFTDKNGKQIKELMLFNMSSFDKLLTQNRKIWKLKRYNVEVILQSICNNSVLFLSKTIEGNTANMHFGKDKGLQENISHNDSFDFANNNNNMVGGKR